MQSPNDGVEILLQHCNTPLSVQAAAQQYAELSMHIHNVCAGISSWPLLSQPFSLVSVALITLSRVWLFCTMCFLLLWPCWKRACLTLAVINLMAALWLLMEDQCLWLLLPWSQALWTTCVLTPLCHWISLLCFLHDPFWISLSLFTSVSSFIPVL